MTNDLQILKRLYKDYTEKYVKNQKTIHFHFPATTGKISNGKRATSNRVIKPLTCGALANNWLNSSLLFAASAEPWIPSPSNPKSEPVIDKKPSQVNILFRYWNHLAAPPGTWLPLLIPNQSSSR